MRRIVILLELPIICALALFEYKQKEFFARV